MRISDWSSDVCSSDLLRAICAAAPKSRSYRPGSFEPHRLARGLVAHLLEDRGLVIGQFGPAADLGQQGAQLQTPFRLHRFLQDGAYFGLGAAAMYGGPHAKGAVHLFGPGRSEEHTSDLKSLLRNS